jgi:type IV secretion system protein VirB4
MVRLQRILREYQDSGSVNSLLALWGFVDDETFLTKAGHVGVVFRLAGIDDECLDEAARRDVVHRFEAALRVLDEHCRVYQYLYKHRMDPIDAAVCDDLVVNDAVQQRVAFLNEHRDELYDMQLYLVLVYEGMPRGQTSTRLQGLFRNPRGALREWLSTQTVLRLLEADVDRAVAQLHHKAAAFEVQLADSVRPIRLGKADAFRFFRRLVNDTAAASGSPLTYDAHLDYFVADSPVECHRTHLDVGEARVKVLTMKEPPAGTYAHVLADLSRVPGEFLACLEWRRIPTDRMRRNIQTRRRHFFNQRVSLVNYLARDTRPDEMLVNESAGEIVARLGDALTEIEVNGHFFGECSLTVVLFDRDPQVVDRAAAEAVKVLATHDGALVAETYNLLNAWLAVVPGNSAHNLRRLALLETNYADLSFLFTLDTGARLSAHLGREALATFETRHQTAYFFNLHVDDVGHTVVVGATGSGKSVLLKFLATHAQKYRPNTVIFDLGCGFRKLSTLLGGSYVEIGLRQHDVSINPFALEPTPEHLHSLHAFVRLLLEGTNAYRLSDTEDRELYDAVENVYVLDTSQRRLLAVANLLPRALAARLSPWVEGGRYADVFDHVEDTLTVQRFQVFDLEGARAYPVVLEPLLFYVLHRVSDRLAASAEAGEFTLCVMDEAWRFIQHDRLRAYVQEALKTWRKRNGAMLLATQSIEDFASADLLRTVVESCPTKLLLANPALDRARYADLFQLNETELELLTTLMPRRQLLLKRPGLAKVLTLNLDPRSYWLYTDTPVDNARVAIMVREQGFEAGLDRLAASAR